VDRPTICQSVRMGRLYSQDSKPKVSLEANATLIFIENNFYKWVP
jgi:proteasome assembly chaperone (PAC2) family protein